jgi:hypothetical protein
MGAARRVPTAKVEKFLAEEFDEEGGVGRPGQRGLLATSFDARPQAHDIQTARAPAMPELFFLQSGRV